ncbi:MAG: FAD-binding oxidoreductase [Burkholderiaceae bacterium]|nr:FAD-binding oxidoreductase [Burkholderiaceae bacterium]
MSAPRFQELAVKRVNPEAAGAVAITFDIPETARDAFDFEPGQFLTLRAQIDGKDIRRNYSISSARSRLRNRGELEIGIRPVEGGLFSNWAAKSVKPGDKISVLPPDGRFVVKKKTCDPSGWLCGRLRHYADSFDCRLNTRGATGF